MKSVINVLHDENTEKEEEADGKLDGAAESHWPAAHLLWSVVTHFSTHLLHNRLFNKTLKRLRPTSLHVDLLLC